MILYINYIDIYISNDLHKQLQISLTKRQLSNGTEPYIKKLWSRFPYHSIHFFIEIEREIVLLK